MHAIKKTIVLFMLFTLLFAALPAYAQDVQTVPVVLGGQTIGSGVLENGRTLVPIRFISEALGYKVEWDEENLRVSIFNGKSFHVLQVGNNVAEVHLNGIKMETVLDVAPKLIQDRTYVPLRYIAESLGCGVLWHSEERAVYLSMPTVFTLENHSVSMIHFTKEDAKNAYAGVYDVLPGADGIERYVYIRPENGNMTVLGFYENQLFELFTNDTSVLINGEPLSKDSAAGFEGMAYVFCDSANAEKPVAFYLSLGGNQYKPYKTEAMHDGVMEQEAKLAYYLTNSLRRKAGKSELIFSEALASVDKSHVADMAEKHFLAHEGLDGKNITERILQQPAYAKYRLLGEVLAKMPNAYYACYGWLNSPKHREAMLDGNYVYSGVCVDGNPGENLYYAQVMIKLK